MVQWDLDKMVLFLWKDVFCSNYDTPGSPLPSLSPEITWIRYWEKYQYSIIHLLHFLLSSYRPTFSTIFTHNCSIFCFPSHSQCLNFSLSRASIVQKKVIYFQDEGSLTIRLCEKGNDSCPSFSSSLLLAAHFFSRLDGYHFCHYSYSRQLSVFQTEGGLWTI